MSQSALALRPPPDFFRFSLLTVCAAIASPMHTLGENSDQTGILQTLQQQALPELIHTITDKKERRLRVLRTSGDAQDNIATQYLVKAYAQATSEGVRCKILESIGKFKDPTQLPWLIRRLDEPAESIQCFAVWALGELRDPRAVTALRQKLWSPHRFVQMTAMDALGKAAPNPGIARELMTFLSDDDVQIRYLAAKALLHTGGPDQVSEWMDRLNQETAIEVQDLLSEAIGSAGGSVGIEQLIQLLKRSSASATEHWVEVGLKAADAKRVIPALEPLLFGDDFRLKLSAARILSELDMPEDAVDRANWMERVMKWAQGSDLIVRSAAERFLERNKVKR